MLKITPEVLPFLEDGKDDVNVPWDGEIDILVCSSEEIAVSQEDGDAFFVLDGPLAKPTNSLFMDNLTYVLRGETKEWNSAGFRKYVPSYLLLLMKTFCVCVYA